MFLFLFTCSEESAREGERDHHKHTHTHIQAARTPSTPQSMPKRTISTHVYNTSHHITSLYVFTVTVCIANSVMSVLTFYSLVYLVCTNYLQSKVVTHLLGYCIHIQLIYCIKLWFHVATYVRAYTWCGCSLVCCRCSIRRWSRFGKWTVTIWAVCWSHSLALTLRSYVYCVPDCKPAEW